MTRPVQSEFETLLSPVLDTAYGIALRMTGNRSDAEDLVQEAALAAFRGFGSFQRGSNFRAWFLKILMNCIYASHRKARPEASLQGVEDAHEFYLFEHTRAAGLHTLSDPVQATIGRLASDDIAAALLSLPDEYRAVCTMYFMDDLSYEDIAGALGVPIGTVRSRLHRGRRMLQKRLWALAVDQGIAPGARTDTVTTQRV